MRRVAASPSLSSRRGGGESGVQLVCDLFNPSGTGGYLTLQDYKGFWMPFTSARKLREAVVSFTEPKNERFIQSGFR